jgi:HEAT repeat protein
MSTAQEQVWRLRRSVPSLIDALSDGARVPISEWIDVDVGSMITTVAWTVRAAAAKSLGQIGPSAKPALPHLAKLLEGEDSKERCAGGVEKLSVSGAIALLDPTARKARREVVAALKSNDAYVRREAATLLGQLGVREPLITSALQKATNDEYKHVRSRAREALKILDERTHCRSGMARTTSAFRLASCSISPPALCLVLTHISGNDEDQASTAIYGRSSP